ncbi:hypothetical protein SteCoe_36460 [Stentor coeruleus]|uniref:Tubulin/FtsZ GTPase domain-containing protein n=1 Tax=Stentor coeruleus TaxID=5963 RepID=A0A1R2AQ50_9CILI|nr:hypothetical protein SteCoe_36460 [Stentor coeruleus]
MKEIISLHLGGAGVQLGNSIWELISLEHNINETGKLAFPSNNNNFTNFYSEINNEVYSPRALFIDTDPVSINNLTRSQYSRLYNPDMLISSKEDSGGVFCKIMCDYVKIDLYMEKLRILAEACDNLQGFSLYFATGGGSGSGISSMILERINSEYENKNIISFPIYPSPEVPKGTLDYYNSAFVTDFLIKYSNSVIVLDNKALYSICKNELQISAPTFTQLNNVASLTINSITSNFRFPNTHFSSLHDISQLLSQNNRNFLTTSFTPISNIDFSDISIENLTDLALSERYSNVGFYKGQSKSYACSITYRGDVDINEIQKTIKTCYDKKIIDFVNESYNKLSYGINSDKPKVFDDMEIFPMDRSVCVMNNSQKIKGLFNKIEKIVTFLYSKRAFVYHYCSSGMEEGEFSESVERLVYLRELYEDTKEN